MEFEARMRLHQIEDMKTNCREPNGVQTYHNGLS